MGDQSEQDLAWGSDRRSDPVVFALHGFLGLGRDWDFLKNQYEIIAPSYLSFDSPFPPQELKTWSNKIAKYVESNLSGKRIFLGYSLGARIGLYLAAYHQNLFDSFILIAPHLGDLNETERITRIRNDATWSKKFLYSDWDEVVSEWNMQSVFENSSDLPERDENNFEREFLAEALSISSIALSEDFSKHPILKDKKVYFLVGEKDFKFQQLYTKWAPTNLIKIKDAGHRAPWDAQKEFIKEFQKCVHG